MDTVKLFKDGNEFIALLGEDVYQGIAGYGYSVSEALRDLAKSIEDDVADEDIQKELPEYEG